MEALSIEIINPKAKRLLKDLADLKLIKIHNEKVSKSEISEILENLREFSSIAPSLEEITQEVELVRAENIILIK